MVTTAHVTSLKMLIRRDSNSNRNLKISNVLLKSQARQLIHERCDESKGGFPKGVKNSPGLISRIPGGDRVAVKVGVVQVEKVNDQMGQGRSVCRDDILILTGRPGGDG